MNFVLFMDFRRFSCCCLSICLFLALQVNYLFLCLAYLPFFVGYALSWYINTLPTYTSTVANDTSDQATTVAAGTTAAGATTGQLVELILSSRELRNH